MSSFIKYIYISVKIFSYNFNNKTRLDMLIIRLITHLEDVLVEPYTDSRYFWGQVTSSVPSSFEQLLSFSNIADIVS